SKEDKRKNYRADSTFCLEGLGDMEALVLETVGAFGYDDHGKATFDNSKDLFVLLAMLKTVADRYQYANKSFSRY
ncbi:hypothetical protein BD770DRAFT_324011, partial [Pilaira anomala]